VYFSNRSAAYANLGKYGEALTDAQVGAQRGSTCESWTHVLVAACGQHPLPWPQHAHISRSLCPGHNMPTSAAQALHLNHCPPLPVLLRLAPSPPPPPTPHTQAVLRLRPGWVKGQARLGAALYGLQQYSEAKEAYQKAMELEPDDQVGHTQRGVGGGWAAGGAGAGGCVAAARPPGGAQQGWPGRKCRQRGRGQNVQQLWENCLPECLALQSHTGQLDMLHVLHTRVIYACVTHVLLLCWVLGAGAAAGV
jgi:hypothetical protein